MSAWFRKKSLTSIESADRKKLTMLERLHRRRGLIYLYYFHKCLSVLLINLLIVLAVGVVLSNSYLETKIPLFVAWYPLFGILYLAIDWQRIFARKRIRIEGKLLSIYPRGNSVLLIPAITVMWFVYMTLDNKVFGIVSYILFYLTTTMLMYCTTIFLMLYPKRIITKLDIKVINIVLFCTAFVAIFIGVLTRVGIKTESLSPIVFVIGCLVFAIKLGLMTFDYYEAKYTSEDVSTANYEA